MEFDNDDRIKLLHFEWMLTVENTSIDKSGTHARTNGESQLESSTCVA